jgi:hypothetical protein
MADFQVSPWSFSDTETTITPMNDDAKARLYGGVSARIKLSQIGMFVEQLESEGFQVEVL